MVQPLLIVLVVVGLVYGLSRSVVHVCRELLPPDEED